MMYGERGYGVEELQEDTAEKMKGEDRHKLYMRYKCPLQRKGIKAEINQPTEEIERRFSSFASISHHHQRQLFRQARYSAGFHACRSFVVTR
jgi:hypothetical protein